MLFKSTLKEIRGSLGRYIAILAIVALGVGFFSGLKLSKPDMVSTADEFFRDSNFFDFQISSSAGYDDNSVDTIAKTKGIGTTEGSISFDILARSRKNDDIVFKTHMITDKINKIQLKEGRLPKKANECVIDAEYAENQNLIGKSFKISDENSKEDRDKFSYDSYKIVGTVTSPLYIDHKRGTSSKGNGTIAGFVYLTEEGFNTDYFTEVYACLEKDYALYSKKYENKMDALEPVLTKNAEKASDDRIKALQEEGLAAIPTEMKSMISMKAQMENKDPNELLLEQIDLPKEADTFVFDRNINIGYSSFDNDTSIVASIATVFPLFFLLVAALVCMTTMTRMVDEQRTQIGVLKALGYSNAAVLGKYLFYAASAAFLGSIAGFFAGSYIFPSVIWHAYGMLYNFSDEVNHIYDLALCIACLIAALACAMLSTLASCLNDFKIAPAQLIRPKAPKSGKRILLEKIPFIWNHLSFLYKVSLRNIFRYKKRFFMMVIGISGCTALLVTGFGIKDSVGNIGEFQYNEITYYDYNLTFTESQTADEQTAFKEKNKDKLTDIKFVSEISADIQKDGKTKSLKLVTADKSGLSDFVDIHNNGKKVKYPGENQVIICDKMARIFDLEKGDKITLKTEDNKELELEVSGIFENYINSYAYITPGTYENQTGEIAPVNTAYANTDAKEDMIFENAASLYDSDDVAAVTVTNDMKSRITSMLDSLNAVIVLVIVSAGALAFIVLYNLTNINITERIREIATIKVLGFYPRETSSYVFRENFFLTGISAFVGLFLGKLLHAFVISRITVDMVSFDTRIMPISYVYAFILTFLFTFIVSGVMYFKLNKISMTESLKSIE